MIKCVIFHRRVRFDMGYDDGMSESNIGSNVTEIYQINTFLRIRYQNVGGVQIVISKAPVVKIFNNV